MASGLVSTVRLNKFISDSGMCSRREADRFIEQGLVLLNGKPAKVGDRVASGDRVSVNGNKIKPRAFDDFLLIALNKPVGIVSTTESSEPDNIVDFVRHTKRIFPIGRLDKDSQGLILLTNNGDLVNKILRAGNNHEKEYVVTVDQTITDDFIQGMRKGVPMLGTRTKRCEVVKERPNVFRITLVQGLNRQIRRMCAYFGYEVVKLERVRIMNVTLKGLPIGEWRDLMPNELKTLLAACEDSTSEAGAAHAKKGGRGQSSGGKSSSKKTPSKKPYKNAGKYRTPSANDAKASGRKGAGKSGAGKGSVGKGGVGRSGAEKSNAKRKPAHAKSTAKSRAPSKQSKSKRR